MEYNSWWHYNQLYITYNYHRHLLTEKQVNSKKNFIAAATQTKLIPETKSIPETKPSLIHMVACKTVREYKRNREKLQKCC